jgi:hypothetical protein
MACPRTTICLRCLFVFAVKAEFANVTATCPDCATPHTEAVQQFDDLKRKAAGIADGRVRPRGGVGPHGPENEQAQHSITPSEARIGRNPRTGEEVPVAAKVRPFFKVGQGLLDRLNRSP